MDFENEVQSVCEHAFKILKLHKLHFKPIRRRKAINTKRSFAIGRTNLKTGLISIDIFTPKKREPKKISSILRVLAHEAAHHQKKPYRQLFKGRIINRQHYPAFYRRVNKNVERLKKDKMLKSYFN